MTDEQARAFAQRIVDADKLRFRIAIALYGLGIAFLAFHLGVWLCQMK